MQTAMQSSPMSSPLTYRGNDEIDGLLVLEGMRLSSGYAAVYVSPYISDERSILRSEYLRFVAQVGCYVVSEGYATRFQICVCVKSLVYTLQKEGPFVTNT